MTKRSQSPQSRWSRKQKARGRCARCGAKRNRYKQLCDFHQGAFTSYMRERRKAAKEIANAVNSATTVGSGNQAGA